MINIKNALNCDGKQISIDLISKNHIEINANGLTLLPGLIDPHVHFRTPGLEYKEDWRFAAKAAIAGGYTTVFDMPNTLPPTVTAALLSEKRMMIDAQLREAAIPLRYQLFFGADKYHLDEIKKVNNEAIGIKVFMGCSTGNLVIDDDESLEKVFAIAANENMIIAVHAEDEARMCQRKKQIMTNNNLPYRAHSEIRDIESAVVAVKKAIALAKKYSVRLYVLHVSSQNEIQLIEEAKMQGVAVFAETTPHHLFLNEDFYDKLQGRAVVNPPIRHSSHQAMIFKAIKAGIIDTIGSDHAPHTLDEKAKPYGVCPSGMPGIETTLPLLLTALRHDQLSLQDIIRLTSTRAREIFNLPQNDDVVLVDLNEARQIDENKLQTKCKWSAFNGDVLYGWPKYTILQGNCFKIDEFNS